jgi:DNA invertase Pin-like site-specific DNA recombinase
MRAAIYTRISEDQTGEGVGVENQLAECRALAERLNLTVVVNLPGMVDGHFDDNDISAFSGKTRPGFEAMLAAIQAGEVDAILCWHIDRLYRRVMDLQRLVEIAESGVQILTVNSGDIDLSTSTGRMLATILGSVAEQECAHKGERRRLANQARAQVGVWRKDQARTFGYTKQGEPLEPEATAVKRAIEGVLEGRSIRSVAIEWNERELFTPKGKKAGGNKWTHLTVRKALMKPVYAGLRVHKGEILGSGTWEPLIDPETHYGLVALLSDPARAPQSRFERRHMGSTIYRCGVEGCGRALYAATHPSGQRLYTCKPSKHLNRLADPVDEYVTAVAFGVLSRTDIVQRLSPRPDIDVDALRAKRKAIEERKNKTAALFAAGTLDEDQLTAATAEFRGQIAGIDAVLAEAVQTSAAVALLADGVDQLRVHWDAASPDIQGKVIAELMTVTLLPAPGRRGILIDAETGKRTVNPEYVRIDPKV